VIVKKIQLVKYLLKRLHKICVHSSIFKGLNNFSVYSQAIKFHACIGVDSDI
jgi:hypothetical protein